MMRTVLAVVVVVMLGAAGAQAHHSYAGFDDGGTTVEAVIESVKIENPHTLIQLRAVNGQRYTVVWDALSGLIRRGFKLEGEGSLQEQLRVGDRMVISGRVKPEGDQILMLPSRLEHKVHGVMFTRDR